MSDFNIIASRRRPLHPAIDEDMVADLVHSFYAKIRRDEVLGPIFDGVIKSDWDAHLEKMCAFWSSVTMMTGRYKGTPMAVHQRISGIQQQHFVRWLELWRQTASERCLPEVSEIFIGCAERIARSLQLAIFYRPEDDAPGLAGDSMVARRQSTAP